MLIYISRHRYCGNLRHIDIYIYTCITFIKGDDVLHAWAIYVHPVLILGFCYLIHTIYSYILTCS